MILIIFALILLILLITIPIIWKLITFVISFMIVIIGAVVMAPFKIIATTSTNIWNGTVPNQRMDSFWKDAANDSTAMWIKGTDGRFFRYGLNLSDEAEDRQVEELNKFYRNHMSR